MTIRERLVKRLAERRARRDEAVAKRKTWLERLKRRQAKVDHTKERLESLPPDPLRLGALLEAAKLVGVSEAGGNNRGPMVEKIIHYALGVVPEPWCVDFVIWAYGHAGSKIVKPGYPRAVRFMVVKGVVPTTAPRPGDIVRYTFDHTGLFVRDLGTSIETIEGNTGTGGAVSDGSSGDGVHRRVRAKSLVRDYLRVTE